MPESKEDRRSETVRLFEANRQAGKSTEECFIRACSRAVYNYSPQEEEWALEFLTSIRSADLGYASFLRSLSLLLIAYSGMEMVGACKCSCSYCAGTLEHAVDRNYIESATDVVARCMGQHFKDPNQFLSILGRSLITLSRSYEAAIEKAEKRRK